MNPKIISRYITRELVGYTLAITLITLMIFIINQLTHSLQRAAEGGISIMAVFKLTALQIPLLQGYLLPLGFYLAILLVLGRLYAEREIVVLTVCGMSQVQLIKIIMLAALGLTMIVSILMCWVEPLSERAQINALNDALKSINVAKIFPRRFQYLPSGSIFYASKRNLDQQKLNHVFFMMGDQQAGAEDIVLAKSAYQVQGDKSQKNKYLVFHDGYHYQGNIDQPNFKIIQFKDLGIASITSKTQYAHWSLGASTSELWRYRHSRLDAMAILQWRLAIPISLLILTFIAVPLSRVNPRSGKFAKFVPAVLIYITYADLLYVGRVWIGNGKLSPSLGLWVIHGLFLFVALALNLIPWLQRFYRIYLARRQYAVS